MLQAQPDSASAGPASVGSGNITVKVKKEDDPYWHIIARLTSQDTPSWHKLESSIQRVFPDLPTTAKPYYIDLDTDKCYVSNNEELDICIQEARQVNATSIKLYLPIHQPFSIPPPSPILNHSQTSTHPTPTTAPASASTPTPFWAQTASPQIQPSLPPHAHQAEPIIRPEPDATAQTVPEPTTTTKNRGRTSHQTPAAVQRRQDHHSHHSVDHARQEMETSPILTAPDMSDYTTPEKAVAGAGRCDWCRKRKKGCDLVLPTCGYCVKRNLECTRDGSNLWDGGESAGRRTSKVSEILNGGAGLESGGGSGSTRSSKRLSVGLDALMPDGETEDVVAGPSRSAGSLKKRAVLDYVDIPSDDPKRRKLSPAGVVRR
ncbi:hypothetical protein HDV00_011331 [Rhizophlyctis rosea]|nr:hypothetical protein HDV00_011331 [Rhizophlyctis rosea]